MRSHNDIERFHVALAQAGVPVDTSSASTPLAAEPAVATLISGMRLAQAYLRIRNAGQGDQPEVDGQSPTPAPTHVIGVLTSPLVGADLLEVRRLGRALKAARQADAATANPQSAQACLVAGLMQPGLLADLDPHRFPAVSSLLRLHDLLEATSAAIGSGGSVEEIVWELWSGAGRRPGEWA